MNNVFNFLYLSLVCLLAVFIVILFLNHKEEKNTFSAYYNTNGSFAGFIQKKTNLFRACEFSTNGAILSCSKWFDDNLLKQGQNEGINQKDI